MTRDDIIRMAREAGFKPHHSPEMWDITIASDEAIERFATLVAAAERESCAKVCDDLQRSYWNSTRVMDEPDAYDCAAAIRARGQG